MAVYFISLRLLMPFLKIELAMLFFYNGLGKVVGGVSFDSSTARFSMDAFEKEYATLLVELAKKISAALSV
jgi:DNA-binding IclR family transcriptional regulator